jgi:predicted short-subunit dehydrogenase-like oxidoreductase (DUF2520 family)
MNTLALAGTGRVAQALGRLLVLSGWRVAAIAGRDSGRAAEAAGFLDCAAAVVAYEELPAYADRVVIAVADDAIEPVAERLARNMRAGMAVHTSGLHGLAPLAALTRAGVRCASLHPLQTVPTPEAGLLALKAAWFGVAGEAEACAFAERMVETIGARSLRLRDEGKALYHAAAVLASNSIVTLIDAAVILMERAGVGSENARRAVQPLVSAAVANAFALGAEEALTGPVRRGDRGTVASHLAALDAADPALAALYRSLGRQTLALAVRAGLDPALAEQLEMTIATNDSSLRDSHV